MTTQHTPGPWTYTHKSETEFCLKAGKEDIISGCGCCGSPAISSDADARLIASAPDLLGALELLVAGIENSVSDTYLPLAKARAAIAKATGGKA